jgi:hypothetical protein
MKALYPSTSLIRPRKKKGLPTHALHQIEINKVHPLIEPMKAAYRAAFAGRAGGNLAFGEKPVVALGTFAILFVDVVKAQLHLFLLAHTPSCD